MGILSRMQGEPMQLFYIKKKNGDPRRDKRICFYYNQGFCGLLSEKCRGSSYCKYYKLRNNNTKFLIDIENFKDTKPISLKVLPTNIDKDIEKTFIHYLSDELELYVKYNLSFFSSKPKTDIYNILKNKINLDYNYKPYSIIFALNNSLTYNKETNLIIFDFSNFITLLTSLTIQKHLYIKEAHDNYTKTSNEITSIIKKLPIKHLTNKTLQISQDISIQIFQILKSFYHKKLSYTKLYNAKYITDCLLNQIEVIENNLLFLDMKKYIDSFLILRKD